MTSEQKSVKRLTAAAGLRHLAALGMLLAVGLAVMADIWFTGHPTRVTLSQQGDIAEQLWYLGIVPHLLSHFTIPLHTNLAYAGSGGVNLMANTTIWVPALILSPFTLLSGPILAFNVGLVLGPVLSGWAMYWALSRWTPSWWLAMSGSVLYAFSPAMVFHLHSGHFQLTFAFALPLFLVLVQDFLSERRTAKATGYLAGALLVVQYFIGAEMLAMDALLLGVAGIAALLVNRTWAVSKLRFAAGVIRPVLFVTVPLLLVPVGYELFGSRSFTGQPGFNTRDGVGLSDFVFPGASHSIGGWLDAAFGYFGASGAPINFIGWGVLVSVLVLGIRYRSAFKVQLLSCTLGLIAVLSLGEGLSSHRGGIPFLNWAPWRLFNHLPVLDQLTVSRLSFLMFFLVSCLLIVLWEELRRELAARGLAQGKATLVLSLAVAVALVPIAVAQALPLATSTSGSPPPYVVHYGAHPDHGARVLFLPYPSTPPALSSPLAWQATSGFTYSILGGYLAVPSPGTTGSIFFVPPTGTEAALLSLGDMFGAHAVTNRQLALINLAIKQRKPTTVMVLPTFNGSSWIAATMTNALGRLPKLHGSVLVWRHVNGPKPLGLTAAQLSACVHARPSLDLLAVPRCVMKAAGR